MGRRLIIKRPVKFSHVDFWQWRRLGKIIAVKACNGVHFPNEYTNSRRRLLSHRKKCLCIFARCLLWKKRFIALPCCNLAGKKIFERNYARNVSVVLCERTLTFVKATLYV